MQTRTQLFYGPFSGTTQLSHAGRNHLLDFMVQGKVTEADTPSFRLGATPSRLISYLPPSSPHFDAGCPSCGNPPTLSWLGTNMLTCIPQKHYKIYRSYTITVIGKCHCLEFSKRRRRAGHAASSACKPADRADAVVGNRLGAEVATDKNLRLTAAASVTHPTSEHVEFRPATQQANTSCQKLSIQRPAQ